MEKYHQHPYSWKLVRPTDKGVQVQLRKIGLANDYPSSNKVTHFM